MAIEKEGKRQIRCWKTPAPERYVRRPRYCKHRGSLLKFVAVSEYSVTQKPSSFQVREILKEEGKFKPPYFQSTVPISIFPPQTWQVWRKEGSQGDQKAKRYFQDAPEHRSYKDPQNLGATSFKFPTRKVHRQNQRALKESVFRIQLPLQAFPLQGTTWIWSLNKQQNLNKGRKRVPSSSSNSKSLNSI